MADPLSPPERRRLGMILAMMTSPADGEALNAARMAVKMLAGKGMRPEDLASHPPPAAGRASGYNDALLRAAQLHSQQLAAENRLLKEQLAAGQQSAPTQAQPAAPLIRDAAEFAGELLDFAAGLTAWEKQFLASMQEKGWSRSTDKQAAVLWRIHNAKMPAELRRSA